jgi:TPP-dependent 2-oxoacid decarboxylase
MGYAVPAAMGAKVGAPDATVWAIDGDGCFQMTNQELVTLVRSTTFQSRLRSLTMNLSEWFASGRPCSTR